MKLPLFLDDAVLVSDCRTNYDSFELACQNFDEFTSISFEI
jgi:hypothetical protein